MTDMINMSRLANGVRSAGLMRRAAAEALFIARHRSAFGQMLIEMPLMRRQLSKMLLTSEQGRSIVFHTARVLDAADRGDAAMALVLRILTPLIRFRICRDARKVTGDAMEVRGGCGYIEEFSDARLLRDSHLGSIWEGTSNIVALDVLRGARRDGALEALDGYLRALPGQSPEIIPARDRAVALVSWVSDRGEPEARRAASALYHATSAAFLTWEADRLKAVDPVQAQVRARLSRMVLAHRLAARDPLASPEAEPEWLPGGWPAPGETPMRRRARRRHERRGGVADRLAAFNDRAGRSR